MDTLSRIYRENLGLATDLYQLTMSYGYWKTGAHTKDAVFNLFFRRNPFKGGYSISCGLTYVIDYLRHFKFDASDLDYLSGLTGNDDKPLFNPGFLTYLGEMEFSCDVDAIPEGTVVFPHEPLLRITGPIVQCQILETALLCVMNFQTLIATKASRIAGAAGDDPVLEFGLRRAQGLDGALSASWAAHVGGCAATSNVLAGKLFGIPVKGTHAHSWIMSFDEELEAFQRYAEAMPNNCVFLVDTYDTIEGVKQAVKVGEWLRENGHKMVGIRLDSGDLAKLSIEARTLLDAAGFDDAVIVASNDLDERLVRTLKGQGCRVNVWGIGTKLVTADEQPALGGVYKLSAVRKEGEENWSYRVKLSEQTIKVSNPGVQQVRRFFRDGRAIGDVIYDGDLGIAEDASLVDPADEDARKNIGDGVTHEDLLTPIFRAGKLIYEEPSLEEIRGRARDQRALFQPAMLELDDPSPYLVGLEEKLFELKTRLIAEARAKK
ncbi:MAG: nicotinate phosphoribosyltransferase [Candidatus Binatia bacterium]|jgi:nicotinate phosphoribosyltransferase